MKSTEFSLLHSDREGVIIVNACESAELRAIEFCTVAWKDGPVLELFTAEDWQNMAEKIKGLPERYAAHLRAYLACTTCLWDETGTQAVIPAHLGEYAELKEKAVYFETGDGRKYLRGSAPQP